mmetsp:Transcript_27105/g.88921  ORF Transcript_27105/g.88921 Transcript_27105/m.88921 type:complete len:226 (+) Transcript_27105:544-1221(+)
MKLWPSTVKLTYSSPSEVPGGLIWKGCPRLHCRMYRFELEFSTLARTVKLWKLCVPSYIFQNPSMRARIASSKTNGSLGVSGASFDRDWCLATSNTCVGMQYSYNRRSHCVFALKPLVTRVYPNTRRRSGSSALMRSTISGGSSIIFSPTTCPIALTPLSVRAQRLQPILVKSPAFSSEMPPARWMARSNSSSIEATPGLRCIPLYPAPMYAMKRATLRFFPPGR